MPYMLDVSRQRTNLKPWGHQSAIFSHLGLAFLFTDDILFKKNNTQLKIEFQYHSSGTQEIFRTYVCCCGKRKYDIPSLDIFLSTHVNHPTSMTVGKTKECFVMKAFRDPIKARRKLAPGSLSDSAREGLESCRKFSIT